MNTKLMLYAALMLFGTFISSVAQVLLKKESEEHHESILKEYLNLRVIIAYSIFFAYTLLCIFSYKVVPLSMGAILEATGYIYVTFFGATIFKEKIGNKKIIALIMIIMGIICFSLF